MAKVLVIRKTDKTIHKVNMQNKATLQAFNNRLPAGQKWTFEEMEEEEADKLPFIDDAYVTAGEAQNKVGVLTQEGEVKDARIAELEAKLAALSASAEPAAPVITAASVKEPAAKK
jgi:hypothetical protein